MTTANNPVVTAEMLKAGASVIATCPEADGFTDEHQARCIYLAMTQASPPPDEMVQSLLEAVDGMLSCADHVDERLRYTVGQAIRAALQSIGPMRGWGPIETAPKDGDGREIMVWAVCEDSGQGWCSIVRWHRDHWCGDEDGSVAPTHWMPLPNPPIRIKGQG